MWADNPRNPMLCLYCILWCAAFPWGNSSFHSVSQYSSQTRLVLRIPWERSYIRSVQCGLLLPLWSLVTHTRRWRFNRWPMSWRSLLSPGLFSTTPLPHWTLHQWNQEQSGLRLPALSPRFVFISTTQHLGVSNLIYEGTALWPPCLAATAQECSSCFAGFLCVTRGLSFPSHICPAGSYCPGRGNNSQHASVLCSPGNMCPPGSDSQVPCSPGTYQDRPGQVRNKRSDLSVPQDHNILSVSWVCVICIVFNNARTVLQLVNFFCLCLCMFALLKLYTLPFIISKTFQTLKYPHLVIFMNICSHNLDFVVCRKADVQNSPSHRQSVLNVQQGFTVRDQWMLTLATCLGLTPQFFVLKDIIAHQVGFILTHNIVKTSHLI